MILLYLEGRRDKDSLTFEEDRKYLNYVLFIKIDLIIVFLTEQEMPFLTQIIVQV